ncbi:FMN-dependent NADH-azoreductase [Actinocrispum wychmicini]|uniref:FMN dependent NADH:quinone oxidoreductase n=1 Tax=Actinocrispum wychmicini TaxID=1213861 RepID=A0A4R2JRL4_9PSEU|nr:NAD(P)H-dependent oxidoreductase [Actinocrispum wychmicini]TCO59858.1 FMN-dependent NADH-azoreductase [Actinocrispum wychmicini]
MNLLHLDASARRTSFSRELSGRFATAWRAARPDSGYVYRDLAVHPVPQIGEAWTELCDAVLAGQIFDPADYASVVRTSGQRAAWAVVEPLLADLLTADVVLIGTPMYNFSVPASLKAWIDQVTFPRMSLAGRSFVVTGARGGSYQPGTPRAPYDHEERYLRDFFAGHFDVKDVTFVHTELSNTLLDPKLAHREGEHHQSREAALHAVDALVADLSTRRRT